MQDYLINVSQLDIVLSDVDLMYWLNIDPT